MSSTAIAPASAATTGQASGSDLYAAAILADVAGLVREAAYYITPELRAALDALAAQAESISARAKTSKSATAAAAAATRRETLERTAERRAVKGPVRSLDAARRRVKLFDRILRVAAQPQRPTTFRAEGLMVDANAVEAALAGHRVILRQQDHAYLFARISVLGGPCDERIDLRRIAYALETSRDALERSYYRFWESLATLREQAAGRLALSEPANAKAGAR